MFSPFDRALKSPALYEPAALRDLADAAKVFKCHTTADVLTSLAGPAPASMARTQIVRVSEVPTVDLRKGGKR